MKKILSILCVVLTLTFIACGQDTKVQDGLALKYLVQQPLHPSTHPPIIIILHGYGSDEADMFSLKNVLPDNYIIIAARAPYALPGGGYQWFDKELINSAYAGSTATIDKSRDLIVSFIAQVVSRYHADAKNVYLMGFSQGAIMSYETGLTHPSSLKGIGILSGALFPSLKPLIKNSPALKQLRIFIAHGTADNVLPYSGGKAGYDYLLGMGLKPELHSYEGMAHTINRDVVNDLNKWLKK